MKKVLSLLLSLITLTLTAQTWTATDMNGVSYDLSTYTSTQGGGIKATLVDISAHWCGPCWGWHTGGVMEELYHDFGPNGTDEFMVFFIDGDAGSSVSILNGAGSSQGDWVTGTPYPLIGPNGQGASVASNYTFPGYPTLFLHCGTPIAPEIQRSEKWVFWDEVLNCSQAFQWQNPDATMLLHHGMQICEAGNELDVEIYNASAYVSLTSAQIELRDPSGVLVHTQTWQGSLQPLTKGTITLNYLITTPGTWTTKVIMPNGVTDTRPNGDEENVEVILGPSNIHQDLTVNIITDSYGSETTWSISDGNVSYMSGGPYSDGTTVQTPLTGTIPANACVTFKIEDSYGDGICCAYGNGSYTITDGNGTIVATGGQFGSKEEVIFQIENTTVGIDEMIYVEENDNRIFDMLGREWKCDFIDLPIGMYIINNNKIFKTK
tara:strand:+ start:3953 stop:5257 length:1305 start_codon:yes stop_codon:yes gene_type:complete